MWLSGSSEAICCDFFFVIQHSNRTEMKKDFLDQVYSRIKLGITLTILFSGTPWHVGLVTIHHLQINVLVPQKGAAQQKGHTAIQKSKCPTSNRADNVLASITLFQTRSFWSSFTLSLKNAPFIIMCFFVCFIYDSSFRVADLTLVNKSIFNIEMEPFSLLKSKQFPLLCVLDVAIYGHHVWHKRNGHKKQFSPSF